MDNIVYSGVITLRIDIIVIGITIIGCIDRVIAAGALNNIVLNRRDLKGDCLKFFETNIADLARSIPGGDGKRPSNLAIFVTFQ